MKKTLTLSTAKIRNIDDLYDFFASEFEKDGVKYFARNLDSLEEIIREFGYTVEIDYLWEFLEIFDTKASQTYFARWYSDDSPTLGEILLEIFAIPIPNLLQSHIEIGHFSGYKTRVFSAFFFEVDSEDDLKSLSEIYQFAEEHSLPFLIIGGGTNLLFARDYFPWIIVKNTLKWWRYNTTTKKLQAFSDEKIWEIAETLEKKYNEPIWHRFIGLPGSMGWFVVGNAGCFGLEAEHNFESAKVFDMNGGKVQNLFSSQMAFWYRDSTLKKTPHLFLICAEFDLSEKRERYSSDVDNIDFRENKQPKGNSCGSFFKNPDRDHSAGSLIEAVGLKGYRHGGARWSDLHANFLLSDGESCKPSDLIELVRLTQKKVKKETGFDLVNEVRIIE